MHCPRRLALVAVIGALLYAPCVAAQVPFEVLHSFSASGYPPVPTADAHLIEGSDGFFYGTVPFGGNNGNGIVYRLAPPPDNTFTVLHTFTGGPDGSYPGPLVQSADGDVYGVTCVGGAVQGGTYIGNGTAYRISSGTYSVTRVFPNTDGIWCPAGLTPGADGNFYGVASSPPASGAGFGPDNGHVFRLSSDGIVVAIVHDFGGSGGGADPFGPLVQDAAGDFYGLTQHTELDAHNQPLGCGTAFKVTASGTFTVLHVFTPTDGCVPYGLALGVDGRFYGVAWDGEPRNNASLVSVASDGTFTRVATFPSPLNGELMLASDGNFYGGSSADGGSVIFRVTPGGTATVVHFFGFEPCVGYAGGCIPIGPLIQGRDGNLYGLTKIGGAEGSGVIFRVAGPSAPTQTVTVAKSGAGTGTVTGSSGGLSCGASCTARYMEQTRLTLTPSPAPGSVFTGWRGDGACAVGSVVITQDVSCTATFEPKGVLVSPSRALHLSSAGLGDAFTYDPSTGAWAMELTGSDGRFSETRGTWVPGWQAYPADFNGDGLADLFLYQSSTGMWYEGVNNGTGGFTYFGGQWTAGWQVVIVDLNGDGRSDVFLYDSGTGDWYRCTTNGPGLFAYTAGRWATGWQLYAADLNGDGLADFLLYNPTSGAWYEAVNGGGGFSYTSGAWAPNWRVVPGDFNGDGRTDFFLYDATTGNWYLATTRPTLDFAYVAGQWTPNWTLTAGDIDGDGRTDLVLYNTSTGGWYQAVSSGNGLFRYASGAWPAGSQVLITDFNDDGHGDVLLYNSSTGQWSQATNGGLGLFTYQTGAWSPGLNVLAGRPGLP